MEFLGVGDDGELSTPTLSVFPLVCIERNGSGLSIPTATAGFMHTEFEWNLIP
jgi:hypothetical protein